MIKKLRLYFNISWVTVVAGLVLIFLLSNSGPSEVKFLGWTLWESPLYVLIFASAILGVLLQVVVKQTRLIVRQLRELKKEKQAQKNDKIAQ